jgi:hypothetical protein
MNSIRQAAGMATLGSARRTRKLASAYASDGELATNAAHAHHVPQRSNVHRIGPVYVHRLTEMNNDERARRR